LLLKRKNKSRRAEWWKLGSMSQFDRAELSWVQLLRLMSTSQSDRVELERFRVAGAWAMVLMSQSNPLELFGLWSKLFEISTRQVVWSIEQSCEGWFGYFPSCAVYVLELYGFRSGFPYKQDQFLFLLVKIWESVSFRHPFKKTSIMEQREYRFI
jgi:hypothetical protein